MSTRTLIVGTTPDYIDKLRRQHPEQLFFITARAKRNGAREAAPGPAEELLFDESVTATALAAKIKDRGVTGDGICAFDCESLALAAELAKELGLPYPDREAIHLCRDKYRSKERWLKAAVNCPEISRPKTITQAEDLCRDATNNWVLKPATGSGSELVFSVNRPQRAAAAFAALQQGLQRRRKDALYNRHGDGSTAIIAERRLQGPEYSVDFIFADPELKILRRTRKIPRPGAHFGTIRTYALVEKLAAAESELADLLKNACRALGLNQVMGMADLVLENGRLYLLELTPRPGGDCLPELLSAAGLPDILDLALGFARREALPKNCQPEPLAALRLHARRAGVIRQIAFPGDDRRVIDCRLLRGPGHRIIMPPADYDSWYLGYLIFRPVAGHSLEEQCHNLHKRLHIELMS